MSTVTSAGASAGFVGALDYARQGIDAGVQSFADAAQAVASGGASGGAADRVVEALSARNQVAASARAFSAADQMLGTLLDLRA